jgi:hypothetical protein
MPDLDGPKGLFSLADFARQVASPINDARIDALTICKTYLKWPRENVGPLGKCISRSNGFWVGSGHDMAMSSSGWRVRYAGLGLGSTSKSSLRRMDERGWMVPGSTTVPCPREPLHSGLKRSRCKPRGRLTILDDATGRPWDEQMYQRVHRSGQRGPKRSCQPNQGAGLRHLVSRTTSIYLRGANDGIPSAGGYLLSTTTTGIQAGSASSRRQLGQSRGGIRCRTSGR